MTAAQARILAVLTALVGAVAVATGVVFVLADSDNGTLRSSTARAAATPAATPASATPLPAKATATSSATTAATAAATPHPAITVRATVAVNVRSGPGTTFPIIATLTAGEQAQVSGRNADASWLGIDLAAGTGWVSAGVVEVTGEPLLAPLVDPATTRTATPSPSATPSPTATASRTATPTPSATTTRGASSTAGASLPDLVLEDVAIGASGHVNLTIGNAGTASLTSKRVSVVALDEAANVVFSELTVPLTIAPGTAVTIELAYRPTVTATATVILNADGSVDELSATNNRRRVTLTPP